MTFDPLLIVETYQETMPHPKRNLTLGWLGHRSPASLRFGKATNPAPARSISSPSPNQTPSPQSKPDRQAATHLSLPLPDYSPIPSTRRRRPLLPRRRRHFRQPHRGPRLLQPHDDLPSSHGLGEIDALHFPATEKLDLRPTAPTSGGSAAAQAARRRPIPSTPFSQRGVAHGRAAASPTLLRRRLPPLPSPRAAGPKLDAQELRCRSDSDHDHDDAHRISSPRRLVSPSPPGIPQGR